MTAVSDAALDEISARLKHEDARLRQRTIWLSLVPILVGLLVLGLAWWGVEQAQRQKTDLQQQKETLTERITVQQDAIQDLEVQRSKLDRDIASRKELLGQFAPKLPATDRAELAKLEQGIDQASSGDLGAAISSYESAIQDYGSSALAYRLTGYAYYAAGQHQQAITVLNKALARDPNDAESRYALGLSIWALGGREKEAATEILRAFASDPAVKARALQDPAYRPVRAYVDANVGLASGSNESEKAWIAKGLTAAKQGEFNDAAKYYESAIKLNPANWQVLHWQGYALYRSKRYDEAIAVMRRAQKLKPNEPEVPYNLALALWKSNKAEEARAALLQAYEVDPKFRLIAQRDPQSRDLRESFPR